jgi:hypothetical protein
LVEWCRNASSTVGSTAGSRICTHKKDATGGQLCVERRRLLRRQIAADQGADEAGAAGGRRGRGDRRCCNVAGRNGNTRRYERSDRCRQTGAENASLPQIGVADHGLPRRRLIAGGLNRAPLCVSGGCRRQNAEICPIDPPALQLGHRLLERRRFFEDGDGFTDRLGQHLVYERSSSAS